ncbi:MAG: glycosyltransferase family 2 protein [Clostridiales bacterium]|nr:glycosyltransferase family 2 protein [Clostridiales bacterium]
MNGKKISVALAAYKGEKYLSRQLDSILPQLGGGDEIIISDDLPGGETQKISEFYADADRRVKYTEGPGRGVIKNFENAIIHCTGDYIFLCDQDDVWLPQKVQRVTEKLDGGALAVLHDAQIGDEDLNITENSFFKAHGTKPGVTANIIRNSYIGCCMAFDARLKEYILPFPDDLPMHDQWIGLIASVKGRVEMIDEPLIIYRRHGGTVTGGSTSAAQKLRWRAAIIKDVLARRSKI